MTEEKETSAARLRDEEDISSGRAVMGSVRTDAGTQAPVDGSTTVDLRQPTAPEQVRAGSEGGNDSYHVLLNVSSSDSAVGGAAQPEVEPEVDSEEEQQGQGAGALEAVGQRLGLAVERQNVDALLSSLRSLLTLLAASQEQTDSGVVLRDEELAAIVLPLMRASYIYAETLQEAQATTVRRIWLQAVLQLSKLVSTGGGAQWAKLKEALLEEQISDVLVNRLKLRLEGWTEEKDDDGEGNSAVSSLLAVLSSLARHAEDHRLSEALGQAGACEVALQALATGLESRHATLLGASCCAMMSLCFRHPPNVGRLLELEADAKVVETLKLAMGQGEATNASGPVQAKGRQSKQAQVLASWACSCLASLMDYAPSISAKQELQAQLGALGLPESLAALLRFKRLQAEPDALVLVMTTVVALLEGSKQNQARMREAGALQTLQAMSLLGGSASDRAGSLRTRGDNIPRGSNTKGQEAFPRLWVERAVAMLQHVEMEVEEPAGTLKRASEVAPEGEASTELSKRPRTERSQAECELETQGQGGDPISEAQRGKRRADQADSGEVGSHFSGDAMEHDGQMYPVPQEPCSSSLPQAQHLQEGEFNDSMMVQNEALDEAEESSVDGIEAFPLDDPDTGDASMGKSEVEGREAAHGPLPVEQAKAPRRRMGRQCEAATLKGRRQLAGATRPPGEGPQETSKQSPGAPNEPEDLSTLVRMLSQASDGKDAFKAWKAVVTLVKSDDPCWQVGNDWDGLLAELVRALIVFPGRSFVVEPVLSYLDDLTGDEACCQHLLDLGVEKGLAAVTRANTVMPDLDLTPTYKACTVVLNMAKRARHEVSSELLAAVRDAVKRYSSVIVLQTFSSLLVPGHQSQRILAEDGGATAVLGALTETRRAPMRVGAALECVSSLCLGDSASAATNRRKLGSQGAIEAISVALSRYAMRAETLTAGVRALWALSINSSSNVARMKAAGMAARLRGPGFQQIIQHHNCHLESCEMCLRSELLRNLEATTSSEDDEVDDSMWRQDGTLKESSEASSHRTGSVPPHDTDTWDLATAEGTEEAERGHDSHVDEQSNRPKTDRTRSVKRQHEPAISKGRGQRAQAEHLAHGGKSVPHGVFALMLMLSEANEAGDVARASEAVSRLHRDAPIGRVSSECDGLLSALVRALVVFSDSPTVTTSALSYLEGFTRNEKRCRQLLALGLDTGLAAVMRATMVTVGQAPDGLTQACNVLLNMATRACHGVSIELLAAVRDAAKRSRSGMLLQTFHSLLVPGSLAQKVLAEDGGDMALIRMVKEKRSSAALLEAALQCISSLCRGDSDVAEINRRQLGAQGAIEAISSALDRFPRSVEVLFAGMEALRTLSIGNHLNVERMREIEVAARLTGPGFQEYVKDPGCSADFCEMCLRLVTNMALPGVIQRDELGHHGACRLVLKVFERRRPSEIHEEARLLTAAIEAMATLCLDCPHNVHRFGPMGCEALCRVLQDGSLACSETLSLASFKALRKQACLATARLLTTHEHRTLLLAPEMLSATAACLQVSRLEEDAPYVEAVLLALEAMTGDNTHPQHIPAPKLVQAAIETLRSMSIRGRDCGLLRRVVELLGKLKASAGVWAAGVGFISNVLRPSLGEEAIRLREALGASGACTVAAEAIGLRTGEPDERVVGSGYWLLADLCLMCPANVGRCIALQAHASALDALRKGAEAADGRVIVQEGDVDGAVGIGLTACGLLRQLLVNATGVGDRQELTRRLRQDGTCEALLAFLESPGVRGQSDRERLVTATVGVLLKDHWEATKRLLEVSSARTLLESAIAQDPGHSFRAATGLSLPVVCPTNALPHPELEGMPSIRSEGHETTEG
jgi:hypothetical protein